MSMCYPLVFCDYKDKAEINDCRSMPKDAITLTFVSFFFAMVDLSPWCLITSKQQLVNILWSLDHFGKMTRGQNVLLQEVIGLFFFF